MDVRITQGVALFCDLGPHDGQIRIPVTAVIYMSPEEYEKYCRNGITLQIPEQS